MPEHDQDRPPQGGFVQSLLASDDRSVDSIIVCGVFALLALIAFCGYATWRDPASFNPINYGTAATALLAGIGGGRRMRDWNQPPPQ
jgi:hypothetical protein